MKTSKRNTGEIRRRNKQGKKASEKTRDEQKGLKCTFG